MMTNLFTLAILTAALAIYAKEAEFDRGAGNPIGAGQIADRASLF